MTNWDHERLSRRELLKRTAAAAAGGTLASALLGCGPPAAGPDAGEPGTDGGASGSDGAAVDSAASDALVPTPACEETDPDQLGPYYRAGAPIRTALNVLGEPGTPLTVRGVVYGTGCAAGLGAALLDVWQANDAGAYDNASADFQMRGRLYAESDGSYELTTLYPGRYEVAPGAFRPRHIHFTVSAPGHASLTTQLYFAGEEGNPGGLAFDTLVAPVTDDGAGGLVAVWNIVLAVA